MATSPNDYVCLECGTEISIVKEPSRKSFVRAETRCPVCYVSTRSQMVKRSMLSKKVSVENIMSKFGLTTSSERQSIFDRFRHAQKIIGKRGVKRLGDVGTSRVYLCESEEGIDSYVVTRRDGFYNCNCPDHLFRHAPCKHIIATMLYQEANGTDPFR